MEARDLWELIDHVGFEHFLVLAGLVYFFWIGRLLAFAMLSLADAVAANTEATNKLILVVMERVERK